MLVCEKLKEYQGYVGNVSGLIGGFVFVVTNSNIEWNRNGIMTDNVRNNALGACLLTSLAFALAATTLAVIIYGNINTIGPNKEMVTRFINEKRVWLVLPQIFMILSLLFMLTGTVFAVGGLYGRHVLIFYITLLVLVFSVVGWYFIVEQGKVNNDYIKILKKMPDFEYGDGHGQ